MQNDPLFGLTITHNYNGDICEGVVESGDEWAVVVRLKDGTARSLSRMRVVVQDMDAYRKAVAKARTE